MEAVFDRDEPCCLAVLELEGFTDFNKRYGRAAGDAALRYTARIIAEYVRKTDLIGRCGGAEFVLFSADADREECREICGRLARNLAAAPLIMEAGAVYLTAGFGTAEAVQLPRGAAERKEYLRKLTERAERALERAGLYQAPALEE
jgi:diguanylate cyclase (GGDEF)-like protein